MRLLLGDTDVSNLAKYSDEAVAAHYPALVPVVRALAIEVQVARARRCENCQYGESFTTKQVRCMNYVSEDKGDGIHHDVDWFCADFTPRDA